MWRYLNEEKFEACTHRAPYKTDQYHRSDYATGSLPWNRMNFIYIPDVDYIQPLYIVWVEYNFFLYLEKIHILIYHAHFSWLYVTFHFFQFSLHVSCNSYLSVPQWTKWQKNVSAFTALIKLMLNHFVCKCWILKTLHRLAVQLFELLFLY